MIEKRDDDETLTKSEKLRLKKRDYDSLKSMTKYAKSKRCLRRELLDYFGEETKLEKCDYCSCCTTKTKLSDITTETKKILKTIDKVNESED